MVPVQQLHVAVENFDAAMNQARKEFVDPLILHLFDMMKETGVLPVCPEELQGIDTDWELRGGVDHVESSLH